MLFKKKEEELRMELGEGVNLDRPEEVIDLSVRDSDRKGHFWCFGTTRVGKTRLLENIIEQDIRKGYSVVAIDPKGDIDLFSKITQIALDTGRIEELILVTPIFPEFSAVLNPLSSHYMPEELAAHITAGVSVGREPFFADLAREVALYIVLSILLLAKNAGQRPRLNLQDIKDKIGHKDLKELKAKIDHLINSGVDEAIRSEAKQLSSDLDRTLATTADNYNKVSSSLRIALTELTTGSIGKIIGKADENKFISRLEEGKGVIMVVQLGSLLTDRAAYTAGKVIISMLKSFIGRRYASGKKLSRPLALHMDEAQSVLYLGIEELFAKAGGADLYIHGYSQSISQLHDQVGEFKASVILDNCNTKIFMRVPDILTAEYISKHLGEKKVFSPMISLGGGCTIRETEELRIKPSDVLNLTSRQFFMTTYAGTYRGYSRDVKDAVVEVVFPDLTITETETVTNA